MRIISRKTLEEGWEKHPQAKSSLQAWYEHAKKADWKTPSDIQRDYNVVILPNNRATFKIKGNDYRLVVAIHYDGQRIYIRFFGTHKEYDRIDATEI